MTAENPTARRNALRASAALAMAAALLFMATAVCLHLLRPDLDWRQATLSRYLLGPHGLALRTVYVVLAVAIVPLALALRASLAPAARSAAPTLLMAGGALSLSGVSIGDSWLPEIDADFHHWFHHACAISAFLLVTAGMVLQAARFRLDAHWRRHHRTAMAWSLACFALLWLHALWPPAKPGWVQKLLIAMIVGAMAMAAGWLWRAARR